MAGSAACQHEWLPSRKRPWDYCPKCGATRNRQVGRPATTVPRADEEATAAAGATAVSATDQAGAQSTNTKPAAENIAPTAEDAASTAEDVSSTATSGAGEPTADDGAKPMSVVQSSGLVPRALTGHAAPGNSSKLDRYRVDQSDRIDQPSPIDESALIGQPSPISELSPIGQPSPIRRPSPIGQAQVRADTELPSMPIRPIATRITRPEPIATPIMIGATEPAADGRQRSRLRTVLMIALLVSLGVLLGFIVADLSRDTREGGSTASLAAAPFLAPRAP